MGAYLYNGIFGLNADVFINLVAAVRHKLVINRPSHLVVFGPGHSHLFLFLLSQLLLRGPPRRHYFPLSWILLLVQIRTQRIRRTTIFHGGCVHTRWWRSAGVVMSRGACRRCRGRQGTVKAVTDIKKATTRAPGGPGLT